MAVAQGLNKQTVFAKQSGLGVLATTGGQIMRRTNSVFALNRDTYDSDAEVASHQQSNGSTHGVGRTTGKLDGLLTPGTYSKPMQSLLRKDYVAISAITGASVTIGAPTNGIYPLSRATGSWLTDGVKIGDIIRLSVGTLNAANIAKNLMVVSISSATAMTVRPLNGSNMQAEGPITGTTVTVVGKRAWVPVTGHTNDYYTVEEWYPDVPASDEFGDVKIASADVALPATGNSTISFDCPGLSRSRSASQQITAPAAETTTPFLAAVNGVVLVNGVPTTITGAQLNITGNIQPGEPEVGSNQISDHIRGKVAVSGSFTAKFSSTVLQALYDNQSVVTLILAVADSNAANADFVAFTLPTIKVFGDTPDDGQAKEIIRTYPFTAQLNGAGGAAVSSLQTILAVQDSQA